MTWAVKTLSDGKLYPCFNDPSYVEHLDALCYSVGEIGKLLTVNQHVQLVNVQDSTVLLDGWLTQCTGPAQGGPISFQIMEYANELTKIPVGSASNNFTVTLAAVTVDSAIDTLLLGTGWSRGSTLGSSFTIPATRFYGTYLQPSIDKIIKTLLVDGSSSSFQEIVYWFDSVAKEVYYGVYRNSWTSGQVSFTTGQFVKRVDLQDSNLRAYDAVFVMGQSPSLTAMYPATPSGSHIAIFNEPLATTTTECAAMAYQLYNTTYGQSTTRPQMMMKSYMGYVGSTRLRVGDMVTVDGTLMMIVDAVWKQDHVTFGFDYAMPLDTVNAQGLSPGSVATGNEMIYSGGWQNLDDVLDTEWYLNILDTSKISNFVISLAIDHWKSEQEIASGNANVGIGLGYISGASAGNSHVSITNAQGYTNITIGTGNAAVSVGSNVTAIAVGGMNNPSYCNQSYQTSSLPAGVTIPGDGTFIQIVGIGDTGVMGTYGRHFGMVSFHMTLAVTQGTPAGMIDLWFKDSAGNNILATSYYPTLLVPPGATSGTTYPSVAITALFPFANPEPNRVINVLARTHVGFSNVYAVEGATIQVSKIGGHNHPVTDGGHGHTNADSGHSHSPSDPTGHDHTAADGSGHTHTVTDASGHVHTSPDSGHVHPVTNAATSVTGYPSTVVIYLYNSTYPTGTIIGTNAGGSKKTITLADIAPKLAAGDNWITVQTASIGSGYLSATFTAFP